MNYTIGYIDFQTRSLKSSENLYDDLSLAAYDLNFTISDLVLNKYDILLRNSFLFVCKDEEKDSNNTVKISNLKSIVTEKKGLELDIFWVNEKKGYIYNAQDKVHLYKFYIKKHIADSLKKEPFGLLNPLKTPIQQGELVIVNNTSTTEEMLSSSTGSLVSNRVITNTDKSAPFTALEKTEPKEISFTQEDLVVLENWLDKNESFVKELSEKVKKYKID